MARNRQRRLQALYDQVSDVHCKGLCTAYCGLVPFQPVEIERLERAGVTPATAIGRDLTCPQLMADGRCSIYPHRPLICRIWGACEELRCPHGCEPDRWLSPAQAQALIDELKAMDNHAEPLVFWQSTVQGK
jgi:Fe-S-cluster containining protein